MNMAVQSSTDLIIPIPTVMTAEAFTDEKQFEALFAQVKEAVGKHDADVSTKAGRDAIKSLAYKVARTKTALVAQGKKLTEDWRAKTKLVNAACNTIEERLDALRDDVRRPVNEWEQAEDDRLNALKDCFSALDAGRADANCPSSQIAAVLAEIEATEIGADWQEYQGEAALAKDRAVKALRDNLAIAERREADAAELAALRAAQAERDRQDEERRAAEEAARAEADRVERERRAEEQRQADIAKAAADAAERAQREAEERIAAAEREAAEAKDRAAREIEEAKAKAIADAEYRENVAAAARAAEEAEQRRRDADKEHRKSVNNAIVTALVACAGITTEQARMIVVDIASGLVPNVTLKY